MQPTLTIPREAEEDARLIFAGEYDMPFIEPPKAILDIGANAGLFSAWAAQEWPDAIIHAFEPDPDNADMFRKNMVPFKNVDFTQAAVSRKSGRFQLFKGGNKMTGTLIDNGNFGIDVSTVSSDSIPHADFIKIDTEGSEFDILESLDLCGVKAIALESHSDSDEKDITYLLKSNEFVLHSRKVTHPGCSLLKFARPGVLREKTQGAFIAVPFYGGFPAQFHGSMMKLIISPPCNITIKHLEGDSLVSRARNSLTAEFLKSDFTDMIFIDSDLVFSPEQIGRLMSHDVDVVAGFYPKKQDGNLRWVVNAIGGEKPDERGLQSVRFMGTGFMRVRRRVFEMMIEKYGDLTAFTPDHLPGETQHDLWPAGVCKYEDGSRRYLSEDWYFCQRWLDMGGKVYGDTGIVLKHIGQAIYPLLHQIPQISSPLEPLIANSSSSK